MNKKSIVHSVKLMAILLASTLSSVTDAIEAGFKMDAEFAQAFARHWVESWNSHDLDQILSHYTDDFSMSSPLIVSLMDEPSGTLAGKEAVGDYWELALSRMPDIHFTLENILIGANSITLIYEGPRGLSAEVFHFDKQGKVHSSSAHYRIDR